MISRSSLKALHGTAALFHLAQFGYAEALVNTKFKDRQGSNLVNVVGSEPGSTEGPLSVKNIGSYDLAQLVPLFSLLSTANHAWSFFDFERYMDYVDNKGYNPVRWAEYSVSASLMVYVVASLSGAIDVKTLSFLVLSNVALQFSGYSIEKDVGTANHSGSRLPMGSAVRQEIVGFLIFLAQLVPIWTAFFTSVSAEDSEAPSFVWAIVFIITALFLSFGIVSVVYLLKVRRSFKSERFDLASFRTIELAYLVLSFVSKTFLMNMVLFGSVRPSDS